MKPKGERDRDTTFEGGGAKTQLIDRQAYVVEVTRKRVKRVNLRIRPDGGVAVSAPSWVPLSEIERFVAEKDPWIRERLASVAARSAARQLGEGDEIPLWGTPRRLRLVEATDRAGEGVSLDGDDLVVATTSAGDADEDRAHREAQLEAFERTELEHAIRELLPEFEARVGRPCSRIRIRPMTSRWGSCNHRTGSITINLELVERPRRCLESVLVHELCHLIEPNHGPRFHALMDRHYPAWPEARALLNANPPRRRR